MFEYPVALVALIVIPVLWLVCHYLTSKQQSSGFGFEDQIDKHLIPHLIQQPKLKTKSRYKTLTLWSIIWTLLVLAIANPRWGFEEVELYEPDASVVVLLDLSQSMNAEDIKPSRIARARQELEDFCNESEGIKIGLVAFAAVPHLVAPITDDKQTLIRLLTILEPSLVSKQGGNLKSAMELSVELLSAEQGKQKSILVVSDGEFADQDLSQSLQATLPSDIHVHVLGIGTKEGAPLKDQDGKWLKKNGQLHISKIDEANLQAVAKLGKGLFLTSHPVKRAYSSLTTPIRGYSDTHNESLGYAKIWQYRYYLFLIPILLIFLSTYRRNILTMVAIATFSSLCMTPSDKVEAVELPNWLQNSEQQGETYFNQGDYLMAAKKFRDHYRKGIALFQAGQYEEAEASFSNVSRQEVQYDALFNKAAAQVFQQKLKPAKESYEQLLKQNPDDKDVQRKLDIVNKMLEQQDSQDQQSQDQKQNQANNESENENSEDEQGDQGQQPETPQKQTADNQDQDSTASEDSDKSNEKSEQAENSQAQSNDNQDEAKETEGQVAEKDLANSDLKDDNQAEYWFSKINPDLKQFMRNKFYLEEKVSKIGQGGKR